MSTLCLHKDKVSEEVERRYRTQAFDQTWTDTCMSSLHPPSQATLCWQGQKRTSSASSEQMRHSLGPGGVGRTRLVMVLGVVWTRRRLALLRPCPHVMACRRCNLSGNKQL